MTRVQVVQMVASAALLFVGACGSSTAPQGSSGSGGSGATGGASAGSGGAAGTGGAGGGVIDASGTGGASDASGSGGATDATDLRDGATDTPSNADGSTDGDSGGAATLKLPIQRGDLHVLEFGSLVFEVKGSLGARVTSLRLDGDELLTGPAAHPQYFGSTLWTSPADDWVIPGTFVPPVPVDSGPYTMTVSPEGVITATNVPSTAKGKRFTVTKVFRADIANNAIVIDYKLTNNGTAGFSLSHWEVTRVRPDGLTFFPTGSMAKADFLRQVMMLRQAQSHTWYDNKTHVALSGESKSGSETTGGYIAHVAPYPRGDLLFVKAFQDVLPGMAPTGHFEVELFCSDAHSYVELEEHSPYAMIAPGQTYTQTVTWYLRRLPAGTDRSVGSPALIAAALRAQGK